MFAERRSDGVRGRERGHLSPADGPVRVVARSLTSVDALVEVVIDSAGRPDVVVVQAGHHFVAPDTATGTVIPLVDDALTEPRHAAQRADHAGFPRLTWTLGLNLLREIPARRRLALVLVNDWQHVSGKYRAAATHLSHSIPRSFADELARHRDVALLRPRARDEADARFEYYREQRLRNQFARRLRRLAKAGALPPDIDVNRRPGETTLRYMGGSNGDSEIYCSNTGAGCAGEVAELLMITAPAVENSVFINLVPLPCREQVRLGTELAMESLGARYARVVNIFLPPWRLSHPHDLLDGAEAMLHVGGE